MASRVKKFKFDRIAARCSPEEYQSTQETCSHRSDGFEKEVSSHRGILRFDFVYSIPRKRDATHLSVVPFSLKSAHLRSKIRLV